MEAKIGQDGWTDQRQTAQSHVNDRIQTNSIEFATIPSHFFYCPSSPSSLLSPSPIPPIGTARPIPPPEGTLRAISLIIL